MSRPSVPFERTQRPPRLARDLRLRDVPAMLPAAWKARRQAAVAPAVDLVTIPVS